MRHGNSRNGFTLVEALVVVALLGIALAPILSTVHRILVASQREERRAVLAEIAESKLSEAMLRLNARHDADIKPIGRSSGGATLPSGWRDSGTELGAFWTIHARPVEMTESIQHWRIDASSRDPDGESATAFREAVIASP